MHKTAVGVIWKSFQNSFRISWISTHFVQKQRYSDLPKYSKYHLFWAMEPFNFDCLQILNTSERTNVVGLIWKSFQNSFVISWIFTDLRCWNLQIHSLNWTQRCCGPVLFPFFPYLPSIYLFCFSASVCVCVRASSFRWQQPQLHALKS